MLSLGDHGEVGVEGDHTIDVCHRNMEIVGNHILHLRRQITEQVLRLMQHVDQLLRIIVERIADIIDLFNLLFREVYNYLHTIATV